MRCLGWVSSKTILRQTVFWQKLHFKSTSFFNSFHQVYPDKPETLVRARPSGVRRRLMKATFLILFAIWDTAPKYILLFLRTETSSAWTGPDLTDTPGNPAHISVLWASHVPHLKWVIWEDESLVYQKRSYSTAIMKLRMKPTLFFRNHKGWWRYPTLKITVSNFLYGF